MIITYTLPPNPPKRFESDFNSIILGRRRKSSQDIDLDLAPDSYVSKRHARITFENKEYWVEDLGSGNGTWVNGEKIAEKTRLMPEDTLRIGWTNIEVQMEGTPAAEMPEDISAILRAEIPAEADDSATPMADEPAIPTAGKGVSFWRAALIFSSTWKRSNCCNSEAAGRQCGWLFRRRTTSPRHPGPL